MEILLVIVGALVVVPILAAIARKRPSSDATAYDGSDKWKAETGHLQPTQKQLDFIDDLLADILDLNDDREQPIPLPAMPRNPSRADASDYIDALIATRDRLEDDEGDNFERQQPTRYRPASIGSRGGMRLEGPDPVCTDLEEAKRHLANCDIPATRTPCIVSDEAGEWKPVWHAEAAQKPRSVASSEDPTSAMSPFVAYNSKHIQDRQVDTLIGLAKGIIADGIVQEQEAEFLAGWLAANHAYIQANPVVDCLLQRVTTMLADGVLDAAESEELLATLREFTGDAPATGELIRSSGLPCDDPPPAIEFGNRVFCFTGKCASGTRRECEEAVVEAGATVVSNVTLKLNYLVLGAYVTPSWAHEAFGRKIEKAIQYRSHPRSDIAIISEAHWLRGLEKNGGRIYRKNERA